MGITALNYRGGVSDLFDIVFRLKYLHPVVNYIAGAIISSPQRSMGFQVHYCHSEVRFEEVVSIKKQFVSLSIVRTPVVFTAVRIPDIIWLLFVSAGRLGSSLYLLHPLQLKCHSSPAESQC